METLNLIPALTDAVADLGFSEPTPIQAKAIPVALEGRDLIGCASTGTGKTAAFLLPILQRLNGAKPDGCRALILSPTRELALQIDEQALALGYYVGLSAVAVVGGVDMRPQERALKAGSDMIVATPGRLLDHMRFGSVDLSGIEVLVLDEADRMLDMGFLPDIKRILEQLPKTRQNLLFSATMSPTIRKLADEILTDPVTVTVDRQRLASGIEQKVFSVGQDDKAALLTRLLRRESITSALVFVKRKADADRLARQVNRAGREATSIHANRTQAQRMEALEDFRRGDCSVLVATDVAARGLDVDGISHVVNFDVPHSPEDYIHRAGRTARAGAAGEVFTFVSAPERDKLAEIEKELGFAIPRSEANARGSSRGESTRRDSKSGASTSKPSGSGNGAAAAAGAPEGAPKAKKRGSRRRPRRGSSSPEAQPS
ncbi:MAG: DEAD/DEAH box helicase [Candidatus Binatia bacterium]|nr:DEAD/DEAH box helicase [Candidatus Binatia bacterium]